MIEYAKKSEMARWKENGNSFAGKYDSKSWGMAWIIEQIDIPEGMKVLDVGHSKNKEVADFFFRKRCDFHAMDILDSDNYLDWFEGMGGRYINRFCGSGGLEEDLKNTFDFVFSLGVLEHTIEWGYPMSVFPILDEMLQLLKVGGILVNIYEPTVFMDTPFNIRNDLAFLSESIVLLDNECQSPTAATIPDMYEIATNPDTILSNAEITYPESKGKNAWTGLGYMGRKIRNISEEKYSWHRDNSPNLLWARFGINYLNHKSLTAIPFNSYQKVMFWGGGSRFRQIYPKIEFFIPKESVVGIIDIDKRKWGTHIYNIPIVEPKRCSEVKPDLIIITSNYYSVILMELKNLMRCYHFDCDHVIL